MGIDELIRDASCFVQAQGIMIGRYLQTKMKIFLPYFRSCTNEIANKLNVAINEILKDPEVAARLEQLSFEPLNLDQKSSEAMFRTDIGKWRSMVEAINLKPKMIVIKPYRRAVVAPIGDKMLRRGEGSPAFLRD